MTARIHLIERLVRVQQPDKTKMIFESGWWAVSPETATKLIGGEIYLHKEQQKRSHFGGTILSFRVETTGSDANRVAFTFSAEARCKDVRAGKDGWGNEKKIVL